jgi:large subunit ribosomal protein LP0
MSSGAEDSVDQKKQAYFTKLIKLLDEFPKVFVVGVDNVGSNHMQKIRKALRGKGEVLMGKNTMIRKAIRGHLQNIPGLSELLPYIRGNMGFVFTKGDLGDVKKILLTERVAAPAKAGAIAPCDVVVPKGNTGMEPTQTSFFQALNIQTKITKGQVEIINDVPLIKKGDKVGASEANLLKRLDIMPFSYGLTIEAVYDNGNIYDLAMLDISEEDIVTKFRGAVRNVACVSLAIGYPTIASLPHSIIRGYKNVLAISLATNYSIPQAEKLKNAAASAPASTAATTGGGAKESAKGAAPAKEEKKEEKKEEEDEDMGFGLFD